MKGGHVTDASAIAISPDGKLLASGSPGFITADSVKMFRVESAELMWTVPNLVNALSFSPDGKQLAGVGGDLITPYGYLGLQMERL